MIHKQFKLYRLSLILSGVLICFTTNQVFAQSLLWEISGNGLEKSSYLFGTMHVLCPDELTLDEKVLDALNKTEQITLELDMDDPGFATKMQSIAVDPQKRNIKSALSGQEIEKVNSFLTANYGITLDQVGMLRPFMVLTMIITKIPECQLSVSYEGKFMEFAAQNGLEIIGLEKIEDQVAVYDKMDYHKQVNSIAKSVIESEKTKAEFEEMANIYKKEDIEALHNFIIQSPELKGFENILLYDRNNRWISKIEKMIWEKPTFIAFGAGHLGSGNGVINLLREQGYFLTPIK